jgi:hypothetical protein
MNVKNLDVSSLPTVPINERLGLPEIGAVYFLISKAIDIPAYPALKQFHFSQGFEKSNLFFIFDDRF